MSDVLGVRKFPELARFFASMALLSFLFHAIWEMAQMPAYKDMAGLPLRETIARCAPATFGDVVITFWIYAVGALAARSFSWGLQPRWNVFLTLALLGAMHAIWIGQAAIANGRWAYTEAMPVFPRLSSRIALASAQIASINELRDSRRRWRAL